MTEWLLIMILMSGGKIDQVNVSRHATIDICETSGVAQMKGKRKGAASFTCFEVARLPKARALNPVSQRKN